MRKSLYLLGIPADLQTGVAGAHCVVDMLIGQLAGQFMANSGQFEASSFHCSDNRCS